MLLSFESRIVHKKNYTSQENLNIFYRQIGKPRKFKIFLQANWGMIGSCEIK